MQIKDFLNKFIIVEEDYERHRIFEMDEDMTLYDDALGAWIQAEELETVITVREYVEHIRSSIHNDA